MDNVHRGTGFTATSYLTNPVAHPVYLKDVYDALESDARHSSHHSSSSDTWNESYTDTSHRSLLSSVGRYISVTQAHHATMPSMARIKEFAYLLAHRGRPKLWNDDQTSVGTLLLEASTRHVNELLLESMISASYLLTNGKMLPTKGKGAADSEEDTEESFFIFNEASTGVEEEDDNSLNTENPQHPLQRSRTGHRPAAHRFHRRNRNKKNDETVQRQLQKRIDFLTEHTRKCTTTRISSRGAALPVALMMLYRLSSLPSSLLDQHERFYSQTPRFCGAGICGFFRALGQLFYHFFCCCCTRKDSSYTTVPSPSLPSGGEDENADTVVFPTYKSLVRSASSVITLLYSTSVDQMLALPELKKWVSSANYLCKDLSSATDTESSEANTALPATLPLEEEPARTLVETSLNSSPLAVQSGKNALSSQQQDLSGVITGHFISRDAIHEVSAAVGLQLPVQLRYMRIGNHLFEVTPVEIKAQVNYVEKRQRRADQLYPRSRSGTPSYEVSFAPSHLTYGSHRKKNRKRRIAASARAFQDNMYSLTPNARTQRKAYICVQCLVAEATVVYLPCGHLVVCEACAAESTVCPCNAKVQKMVILNQ